MLFLKIFVLLPLSLFGGSIIGGIASVFIAVSFNQFWADIGFWIATIIFTCYFFAYLHDIFSDKAISEEEILQLQDDPSRRSHSRLPSFLLGYFLGKSRD